MKAIIDPVQLRNVHIILTEEDASYFLGFFGELLGPSPMIQGIYDTLNEVLGGISHTEVQHLGKLDARRSIGLER